MENTNNSQLVKNSDNTVNSEVIDTSFNGMDKDIWYGIVKTAKIQLDQSRQYKFPRMVQIQENENLYLNIAEQEYKNPYNYCYPYMAGYVDQLMGEISDPPAVKFGHTDEADYKAGVRTSALFDQLSKSMLPHAQWNIKDRFSKKLAIFSGVGILKFHTEASPFKAVLNNVDHYDFHCEPAGGALLENHLFCGEEGIFKTKEEIQAGIDAGYYEKTNSEALINRTSQQDYKDNSEAYNQKLNRFKAMGLDPESNNYVGQSIFKLVEWYITYNGIRYYCLFEERSCIAIRICKLRDMFAVIEPNDEALYPYSVWHTHEDPKVFWSKSPCDDVKPVAKTINKLINQQLYNRDKQNMGHRLYDPKMVKDVKSLGDWRVDGLTPVDTQNGQKVPAQAVHVLQTGNLSGTMELVTFINDFAGQKTGVTPSSQGNAPSSQKVGIFYGEIQQISKRLTVYNASYKECWAGIGLRFRAGLVNIKDDKIKVKIMGAKGIEWDSVSSEDLKTISDYDILVEGGNDTQLRKQQEMERKAGILDKVATVNPKWKDKQRLLAVGYTEEDIKEAFSIEDPGLKELLSEAAQAEQEIVEGKDPEINRGATAAFMQHIIDFAQNLSMEDKEKENAIAIKLLVYARRHAPIATENAARNALAMINEAKMAGQVANNAQVVPNQQVNNGGESSTTLPTEADMVNNPIGQAQKISDKYQNKTNLLTGKA